MHGFNCISFLLPSQKNIKKKKQREQLRIQITRVFALTAEHGCFRQSPMTRTDKGEVSPVFLEFIEGIRYRISRVISQTGV